MKKIIFILALLTIVFFALAWVFAGSSTRFTSSKKAFYIHSNAATKKAVLDSLKADSVIRNELAFNWLADRMDYWKNIKPGKYEIKRGSSLLTVLRLLKNGRQSPVNFTITKLRTKEDLARIVGNKFETDSVQMLRFLNSPDSLNRFDEDTSSVMCSVLPDTYIYFWNIHPSDIFEKLSEASKKFWTEERKRKASEHGLTPRQVYILASIIEEETNYQPEKGNIASVYINRYNKGMPLQADPTIKFALRDFGLKRIYGKYTAVESPYNTYKNKGLPPGPICTPSRKTIEAVLDAPHTNYMYFVVNSGHTGTHAFSETYEEHLEKARQYHIHLDSVQKAEEVINNGSQK
jgi:UPF0755 protein